MPVIKCPECDKTDLLQNGACGQYMIVGFTCKGCHNHFWYDSNPQPAPKKEDPTDG